MNHEPNVTFSAVIHQEAMKALRAGMPLENVIASLIHQAELLQLSLPVVNAMRDAGRNPA